MTKKIALAAVALLFTLFTVSAQTVKEHADKCCKKAACCVHACSMGGACCAR